MRHETSWYVIVERLEPVYSFTSYFYSKTNILYSLALSCEQVAFCDRSRSNSSPSTTRASMDDPPVEPLDPDEWVGVIDPEATVEDGRDSPPNEVRNCTSVCVKGSRTFLGTMIMNVSFEKNTWIFVILNIDRRLHYKKWLFCYNRKIKHTYTYVVLMASLYWSIVHVCFWKIETFGSFCSDLQPELHPYYIRTPYFFVSHSLLKSIF